VGEGLNGRVAQTGEPILLSHLDPQALRGQLRPSDVSLLEWLASSSMVVVPVRARGRLLGTLSALRARGSDGFTPADLDVLSDLGERAGLALESGQLHEENERERQRAELLYRLAAGVIGAERAEDVFRVALDGLEQALGAERASILAFDPDGVMRFKAWRGLSDTYRGLVEGHSPWTRETVAPEPLVVSDVESDASLAGFGSVFRDEGIRALGFIPLVYAGELLGKFMVYYRQPRALSERELEMARAIANHVAAAIARFAAVAELQRTVRFNEMFTGMLGHDLRNPLGAIMMAAQVARARAGDDDRLAGALERITRAGRRMERMIDQLLDFTRVRVGDGIPLLTRPFDVVSSLRQVIEEIEHAQPGCWLVLEHGGDSQGTWDGDRLSQVFSNLVANAVQHGVQEHPVHVRFDGHEGERVRVTIHNAGPIPDELLPHLFEPMAGGERRRDGSRGLGLGLFISEQIVRAHGGCLTVRSDPGGTTFTVELPRHCPDDASP
jgi:signal transduction histidine kinase